MLGSRHWYRGLELESGGDHQLADPIDRGCRGYAPICRDCYGTALVKLDLHDLNIATQRPQQSEQLEQPGSAPTDLL